MDKQGAPDSTQTSQGNIQEGEAEISMTFMRKLIKHQQSQFPKENLVEDRARNSSYREQKKQCSLCISYGITFRSEQV